MQAEIKNDELIIRVKIDKNLPPSTSGKSRLLATSGGNPSTDLKYQGKDVKINLTAYVKNDVKE